MKIAYLTSYLGKEFISRYGEGKSFALSGSLKSLGIARALMSLGHEVIIYSPGITTCDTVIRSFTEYEEYPEGKLTIKYSDIISKRRCDPINQVLVSNYLRKEHKCLKFDVLLYYNITIGASLVLSSINNCINILEYEDNIFNRAKENGRNYFLGLKTKLYQYIIKHTDGLISVCNGLLLNEISHKILVPGILNEDVLDNVSKRINRLSQGKPVHIILTGGIHYSKGGDILVKAMSFIKTPCIVSVYGNCTLNDTMKNLIKEVPSHHMFDFKGYAPHSTLIKILDETADILINTTRSMQVGAQAAGFPFKIMEYASTGRPIVSSEIAKLDEEFNSYITYYDGEDPRAVAKAIEDVIADYDQKVSLALQLQIKVIAEYCINSVGIKLNELLKNLAIYKHKG